MTSGTPEGDLPPGVNLLPPEAAVRQRIRRLRLQALAALGGVGAAVAVAAGGSWSQAQTTERALGVAVAEQERLRQASAELRSVSTLASQVQATQTQLSQALAAELRWSRYLADLSGRTPEQVWLLYLSAAQDGSDPASALDPAATPTPSAPATPGFGTPDTRLVGVNAIGQARFIGRAQSHDDVAAFLAAVGQQPGHSAAYLERSTATQDEAGRDVIAFTAYVTLTSELLSGRYAARVAE